MADRQPTIHHSDQGVLYAGTAYVELLQARGTAISMTDTGAAWQNGDAEPVMRTIKEEEVNLFEYRDYHDACWQIGRFLEDGHMHKRIHSALGYLTPVEFETQWAHSRAIHPHPQWQSPRTCPVLGVRYTWRYLGHESYV